MLSWILVIIIIISLGIIIFIIIKKFSKLALIDVENALSQKQGEVKRKIIEERLKRNLSEITGKSYKYLKPLIIKLGEILKKFLNKIIELEEEYRLRVLNLRLKDKIFKDQRISHLLNEAENLKKEEKYELAEKKYIEIIKIDQFYLDAYKGLVDLYYQTKDYDHAKETLEYALKIGTNDDFLYSQRAMISMARGDLKKAEEDLLYSLNLNNQNAANYFELSNIYLHLEDYQKALVAAKKSISLEENNPKYLDLLLEVSLLVKDKVLAKETWEKLKNVNPENQKLADFKDRIEKI